MWKLLILLIIPLCLIEGAPLLKKERRREMVVFGVLIGAVLIIVVMDAFHLPSPLELLEQCLRPVGEVILKHQ